MKKIVCLVFLLIVLYSTLFAFSYQRISLEEFYTLPQAKSYIYEENRRMKFEIYSTKKDTLITMKEKNTYFLKTKSLKFELQQIEVETISLNTMFLYRITCKVPYLQDNLFKESKVTLFITNAKYSIEFEIGSLSILNPKDYELLSIDRFYGSYAYINKTLELVGLNITFNNSYKKISEISIGKMVYGDLKHCIKNKHFPNEIDIISLIPNYEVEKIEEKESLSMDTNTYFIPMSYSNLETVTQGFITFVLDDKKYYMDTFDFIVNSLDFDLYKGKMKKGDLKYATN